MGEDSEKVVNVVAKALPWKERRQKARDSSRWIGGFYQGATLAFKVNGERTKWHVRARIGKEKDHSESIDHSPPLDSSAVFVCVREGQQEAPIKAILKVYMQ